MWAKEIIEKMRELDLPAGQYAVFGSGPMALAGLRSVRDIDLVLLPELYRQLVMQGWKEVPHGDDFMIVHPSEPIEAMCTWGPYGEHGEYDPDVKKLIADADLIQGVPFVRLEECLLWKMAFGREKDKKDIALIANHFDGLLETNVEKIWE